MTPTRSLPRLGVSAALLFSVVGAAAIAAQPERPARTRAEQPPLLRGPSVDDAGIPGTARAFSMDEMAAGAPQRALNREIPMNEFMGAIRDLNGPTAPEGLHLTPPQREAMAAIIREHGDALREHMAGHRDELVELGEVLGFDPTESQRFERVMDQRLADGERRARRSVGAETARGARGGETSDAPTPAGRSPEEVVRARVGENPTPEQRGALERLRQIRTGGPSGLEAQTKAWNVLTTPQQEFVHARLEEGRARMEARRGEMYVEQMVGRAGDAQASDRAPQRPPAPGAQGGAAQRLHRIIDELSAQEQEMLLRMIETRLQQRRTQGAGQPGQPGPGRRPQPPGMDRINVPPADPV